MTNGVPDRISAIRVLITAALGLTALLVLMAATMQSAQAQTYSVLFQFRPGADGTNPWGSLVLDSKGNLYSTTYHDGATAYGTVFKLNSAGKETVLYNFTGTGGDGELPYAGVVRDGAGNLYGTTLYGGAYAGACSGWGCGTVFKLNSAGKETVLHKFTGNPDGSNPYAGLRRDAAGNLYGTTSNGGSSGFGTVFKVDTAGKETVLYSFSLQNGDGGIPYAGLVRDAAGNLYGTTSNGGANYGGTVFKVDTTGKETVLYNFCSTSDCTDGYYSQASLIFDAAGNLYGTTSYGGANGYGTVFQLTPGTGGTWTETVLYSFCPASGCTDGDIPKPVWSGTARATSMAPLPRAELRASEPFSSWIKPGKKRCCTASRVRMGKFRAHLWCGTRRATSTALPAKVGLMAAGLCSSSLLNSNGKSSWT